MTTKIEKLLSLKAYYNSKMCISTIGVIDFRIWASKISYTKRSDMVYACRLRKNNYICCIHCILIIVLNAEDIFYVLISNIYKCRPKKVRNVDQISNSFNFTQ